MHAPRLGSDDHRRGSAMHFTHSDKVKALQDKLTAFMEAEIYPN